MNVRADNIPKGTAAVSRVLQGELPALLYIRKLVTLVGVGANRLEILSVVALMEFRDKLSGFALARNPVVSKSERNSQKETDRGRSPPSRQVSRARSPIVVSFEVSCAFLQDLVGRLRGSFNA